MTTREGEMMGDSSLLNNVFGIGSIAVGIVAVVNEELRVPFGIAAAVLILIVGINGFFTEIENLKKDQQRILERTDIYRELIDIKADIKNLKRGRA